MERFTSKFPDKAQDVRVIWKSPLIPNDPLVWRKDLSPELKKKVRDFFLSYGTGPDAAREKANMVKITTNGFKASDDKQLIPIRQLELFKDKTKLESDTAMKPAERDAKIAEINRKLAGLQSQRPLTHDLIGRVLKTLGYRLHRVLITELRDATFFANLAVIPSELGKTEPERLIDCRPSDAIALAVQTGARIFVARAVIDEVAQG